MNPAKHVSEMLKRCGAVLKRHRKHEVWSLPNGKTFVRSTTPSDINAERNHLRDLRHALGNVPVHQPGERRERRRKSSPERHVTITPTVNTVIADKLKLSGVVEASLRVEIDDLKRKVAAAEEKAAACWWCRLKEWHQRRSGVGSENQETNTKSSQPSQCL